MTTTRFQLKPMEHIGAPETKQGFNLDLFAEVAPKYDFITKALSFGRDASWKRALLAGLPDKANPTCVDLACGTGDITRLLKTRYPDAQISGLDLTPAMLEIAWSRTSDPRIAYMEGSMANLPFHDASIDVVTGGYALRNAPDLNQAIDEISRILRPGGAAAFLDFSKPKNKLGQGLNYLLLKFWGGLWGLLLHRNADVYGYIADSLKLYPDRHALHSRFEERGFRHLRSRRLFCGLLERVWFQKTEDKNRAS